MNTYYVLWTYAANYSSLLKIEAKSAEFAASHAMYFFGDEACKKAKVYVFDAPPCFTMNVQKED